MNGCEEIQYYQFTLGLVILVGSFLYYRQYTKLKQVMESENKLIDEVYFDPLTNLPNSKNIDIILNDQISRCARHKKSFFLAYIKIDNLNEIFHKNSKDYGDKMIQKASDYIYNSIRNEDMVGRVGRDSFVIIFNEYLEKDKLEYIFKRLHKSLIDDFKVSIGISEFMDNSIDTQSLIASAKNALREVTKDDTYLFHLNGQGY